MGCHLLLFCGLVLENWGGVDGNILLITVMILLDTGLVFVDLSRFELSKSTI